MLMVPEKTHLLTFLLYWDWPLPLFICHQISLPLKTLVCLPVMSLHKSILLIQLLLFLFSIMTLHWVLLYFKVCWHNYVCFVLFFREDVACSKAAIIAIHSSKGLYRKRHMYLSSSFTFAYFYTYTFMYSDVIFCVFTSIKNL